jgi:hypothetical protein
MKFMSTLSINEHIWRMMADPGIHVRHLGTRNFIIDEYIKTCRMNKGVNCSVSVTNFIQMD